MMIITDWTYNAICIVAKNIRIVTIVPCASFEAKVVQFWVRNIFCNKFRIYKIQKSALK